MELLKSPVALVFAGGKFLQHLNTKRQRLSLLSNSDIGELNKKATL